MIRSLAILALLLGLSSEADAATRYVRTDGGTATQCNGSADAPYPGSGTNQNCAWSHPSWALGVYGGSGRLQGGDVLIIKNGSYAMGMGAPANADKSTCSSSVNCYLLAPPSGTSANPTIIQGEQAGNCQVMPELWGTSGVRHIIGADNRQWVQYKCLEITDRSNCLYDHYDANLACTTSKNYARHGFQAWNAQNILLEDVNIHGLGQNCYKGSKIFNWTMIRTRLVACGDAGLHGNQDGTTDDSFSGTIYMKNVEIAWNGCTEDYPTLKIHGCYGEPGGGYGDGVGTTYTSGTWIIEDSAIHHNTSDGLDLRYTNHVDAETIIRRSWFYNNAGNQVKVWGKTTIESSFIGSYCTYFGTRFGSVNGSTTPQPCRADGNAIFIVVPNISGIGVIIRHSTVTGNSAALFQFNNEASATSSSIVRLENNIVVGQVAYNSTTTRSKYISNNTNATIQQYNNQVYQAGSTSCSSSTECITTNPQLRNQTISTFDPRLTSSSPAIGAGVTSCGSTSCVRPTTDINGKTRPNPASRGAFEYAP